MNEMKKTQAFTRPLVFCRVLIPHLKRITRDTVTRHLIATLLSVPALSRMLTKYYGTLDAFDLLIVG
jgi:hypothetical protein